MSCKIIPIIMAGGSGSRLWPLSRELYPKQFLTLSNESSMLQETVNRLTGIVAEDPILICNEEHRFIAAEQLRAGGYDHNGIILEPVGRNTAPAIALAALQALKMSDDDPILLILAADHLIKDTDAFKEAVERALPCANDGLLATFGIVPTAPETGYGYIMAGDSSGTAFNVSKFVEKPDLETAKHYVSSGAYYWNSGMFMFKASRYIEELRHFRPDILVSCELAMSETEKDMDFVRINKSAFEECPDDSIDYAVMERTNSAVVVPMDAGWSDVGSWSALWDVSNKDADGNATSGDVLSHNTKNSYVYAQDKLVATVGVENLVIVETKDAVLVSSKDRVQEVKSIVTKLKASERTECSQHREVYRPWGTHDAIAEGERFRVKSVVVKPGERTATQIHYHRSEHWIVVSGTAKVRNGDKTYLVIENESTYIPNGSPHSFENPGKIPLEIIEVRTGTYLEEDDIVRFDTLGEGY